MQKLSSYITEPAQGPNQLGAKMRILVIDNTAANLTKAQQELAGHELTLVDSFEAAEKLLTPKCDYLKSQKRFKKLMAEAGYTDLKRVFGGDLEEESRVTVWKCAAQADREASTYQQFDVMLSDLMMPAPEEVLSQEAKAHFHKEEQPMGSFLVLLAMKAGVKKIGLVTNMNHHHHPASAALDGFNTRRTGGFSIGDTKVVCWNYGKNWRLAFKLLNGEVPEDI
jgi:CheY-like chemotaxis protein